MRRRPVRVGGFGELRVVGSGLHAVVANELQSRQWRVFVLTATSQHELTRRDGEPELERALVTCLEALHAAHAREHAGSLASRL